MAMSGLIPQPSMLGLSDSELAQHLRDPERRDRAREALVYRYQPLVRTLARQYQLPAQHHEDLTQACYVGLMKATNSFDPAIRPDLKPSRGPVSPGKSSGTSGTSDGSCRCWPG
jgi:hypothetical protein